MNRYYLQCKALPKPAGTCTRLTGRVRKYSSSAKKARVSRQHAIHLQSGADISMWTGTCADTFTANTNGERMILKPRGTCTRLPGRSGKYRSATRQSVIGIQQSFPLRPHQLRVEHPTLMPMFLWQQQQQQVMWQIKTTPLAC